MRLHRKLIKKESGASEKSLPVPRVITIFQKCVEHRIQDSLIKKLHFNDLYVLILSLDIANIKQALKQRRDVELKKHGGVEVRDISQEAALKFLKGGGANEC